MPFLDTLVKTKANNSLSITVYCTSPAILTSTYSGIAIIISLLSNSVIGTVTHRAKTVCTSPELFQREIQHLREAYGQVQIPRVGHSKGSKQVH